LQRSSQLEERPFRHGQSSEENQAGGDAFVYFISGDKVRNPAAAQALIKKLG
jgi:hypothetical protein